MAQEVATDTAFLATPSSEVNYDLAYPGILPDNPLYFLKAFRDRVVSLLITDTMKKVEFMVLTSDKRMFAGLMLLEKEKYDLGIETLSKSNNYMHEALVAFTTFRKTHKDQASSLKGKLYNSVRKHKELAEKQKTSIPDQYKSRLQNEITRMEEFEKTLVSLK